MSAWHENLLLLTSEVLATYDPSTCSVEEQVTNFLRDHQVQDEGDRMFITEVFSGCVRYSNAISVVLEGFYNRDGKNTLRSQQSIYHVLCYLAIFRLDELGVAQYSKFVQCVDVNAVYKFLNFFLQEKNLLTWVRDGWSTIYEGSFVKTTLLDPLLRWIPELQDMVTHLKKKIDNKLKPKKVTIPSTETKPFSLTQPRPRSVPMPEPIPKLQKHNPVPKTLYVEPKEQAVVAKQKQKNRQKAEERLMEASRVRFACANPQKSHKTREVVKNIVSEQDSKLEFDRHRARPVPAFLSKEIPIKMTTATILREGQLYQKQEEEEMKKIAKLESGTRNSLEFDEWQASMRKKDLEANLAEVERRRLLGKLSYEEAILARQNLMEENRQKVAQMKKEADALMQEYLEQKLQEEQNIKNMVDQTHQGHRNAKDSQKRLQESKRKIVQQVAAENRELMRQALEEAEAEMRKKLELIHQIRAAEASPAPRQKMVDLTSTAGAWLLSEMSIAELRERLALMKVSQKETEEKKRDEILEGKQAKDQQLIQTLECISKHRLEQTRSAALKLEDKKKGKPTREVPETGQLTDLQRQVEMKRQARLRAQEQSKTTCGRSSAVRSAILIGQKKAMEESRWAELEKSRERTARFMSGGGNKYSETAQRLTSFSAVTMAT